MSAKVEVETVDDNKKETETKTTEKKIEKRTQIFVTNLKPSLTEEFICTRFKQVGTVLHYFKPPISQDDRGCCILTYGTLEEAKEAKTKFTRVNLTDDVLSEENYELQIQIQERFMEPDMLDKMAANTPPKTAPPIIKETKKTEEEPKRDVPSITAEEASQIFVTDMKKSTTEEQICDVFSEFGAIVHYFTPPIDQNFKRCCILTFRSVDASQKAKEKYDDTDLGLGDEGIKVTVSVQEKFIAPLALEKMKKETLSKQEAKNIEKLAMQSAISDLENSTDPRARKAARILKAKSLGLDAKALAELMKDDFEIEKIASGNQEGGNQKLNDIAEEKEEDDENEDEKEEDAKIEGKEDAEEKEEEKVKHEKHNIMDKIP